MSQEPVLVSSLIVIDAIPVDKSCKVQINKYDRIGLLFFELAVEVGLIGKYFPLRLFYLGIVLSSTRNEPNSFIVTFLAMEFFSLGITLTT